MLTDEQLKRLLSPAKLKLPARPKVARIKVVDGIDHVGEPSLFIWVLMADETSDEDQTWEMVRPIRDIIVSEVRKAGETRWPYVRFQTDAEHRELIEQPT